MKTASLIALTVVAFIVSPTVAGAYVLFAATGTDVSAGSRAIAMGDLNGDPALDVIATLQVTSPGDPAAIALLGGAGSLSAAGAMTGAVDPQGVDVGDVDGDGDLDAVIADAGGGVVVARNLGFGAWSSSVVPIGTAHATDAALARMDRNASLDLIIGRDDGQVATALNDGTGGYTVQGSLVVGNGAVRVVAGDADGDGDNDVATGSATTVAMVLNDGGGQLDYSSDGQHGSGGPVTGLAFTDVDADGYRDLVFSSASGVFLRLGGGHSSPMSASRLVTDQGSDVRGVAVADFDDDGLPDVAFAGEGAGVRVAHNLGGAEFATEGSIGAGIVGRTTTPTTDLVAGDVNGDGLADLVAANGGRTIVTLGNVTFPALAATPGSPNFGRVVGAVGSVLRSSSMRIAVKNMGLASARISRVGFARSGVGGPFVLTGTNCLTRPLAPNDECDVTIRAQSDGPGRESDTLQLVAARNTLSVPVSATFEFPPGRASCFVPFLHALTLAAAKEKLARYGCAAGRIAKPRKPKGRRLRTLVVAGASPPARTRLLTHSKVNLRLKERPKRKVRR